MNTLVPNTLLITVAYKGFALPAGIFSMPVFIIYGWLNRKNWIAFKPMGSGSKGGFGALPSLHHWALFVVYQDNMPLEIPSFCRRWFQFFGATVRIFWLRPFQAHGTWDGASLYKNLTHSHPLNYKVAILTRATIRNHSIRSFFGEVKAVAAEMEASPGYCYSTGIGEIPWKKQATFSVWENIDAVKQFAYRQRVHSHIVKRTRKEDWYSEEMFVRYTVVKMTGPGRMKSSYSI